MGGELREVRLQAQRLLQEAYSQSENANSMRNGTADSPEATGHMEESQDIGLYMGGM